MCDLAPLALVILVLSDEVFHLRFSGWLPESLLEDSLQLTLFIKVLNFIKEAFHFIVFGLYQAVDHLL